MRLSFFLLFASCCVLCGSASAADNIFGGRFQAAETAMFASKSFSLRAASRLEPQAREAAAKHDHVLLLADRQLTAFGKSSRSKTLASVLENFGKP